MKEISSDLAAYIRQNSNAHIRRTAHKYYVAETPKAKNLIHKYEASTKKPIGGDKN